MARNENYEYTQADLDNHANQLNENNDAYWQSRDYDERPDDWESRSDDNSSDDSSNDSSDDSSDQK